MALVTTTEMVIVENVEKVLEYRLAFLKSVYEWLIPICIIILTIAIVGNGVIVLSSPWLTSPVSPYLKLCISLAAADIWAASLLITGLIVNSYLPVVLGFQKESRCTDAWLEMFRIAGMLTSDMHLFALAINQFLGTLWPLKYKILVTGRRIRAIILSLWIVPLLFVFCWFIANEDDGLRHPQCIFQFYNRFPFRITIFLIFMLPLFSTLVIYGVILITLLQAKAQFETGVNDRRLNVRRSNVAGKLKLVWTTLIIVSSFCISWGLCVLYFVLVCTDGCMFKYNVSLDFHLSLILNSSVNCLVMLKLAANPFIYTLRINAIRTSVAGLRGVFCARQRNFVDSSTKTALLSTSQVPCKSSVSLQSHT